MPSPIGHMLGGVAVYLAGTRKGSGSPFVLGITLLGSIVPDFDFLPGMLIGEPAAFHHGPSHSFASAILFAGVVFFVVHRFKDKTLATKVAVLASLAYVSHIVLDVVSVAEQARGLPILWPLWSDRFGLNLGLLGHFRHSDSGNGLWIWTLIRWGNVVVVTREIAVLGPPILLLWYWREWRCAAVPTERAFEREPRSPLQS